MGKYLIHYFTGTGNTYHMVKVMKQELESKGYEVDLLNVEKNGDIYLKLDDYELNIFCFPVYGFGTPSIMLKYISDMNGTIQTNAAIVCTSGGFEGQSLSHFKSVLNKKGFKVFFTEMIIYTYNWTQVLNPQDKKIEEKVFKEADSKVIEVIEKITTKKTNFKKRNVITVILSWIIFILFSKLARRILGKTFIADKSCIICGKCKNNCPAKAIDINNGRVSWNWKCESCQRCINMCPQKSIQLSIVKLGVFLFLELMPIWIILNINSYITQLSIISNVIIFFIMFLISNVLAGILIDIMEKVRIFRNILEISYTKKYRRNVASDFKIK